MHLWQARRNYVLFGASEESRTKNARPPKDYELPENNLYQPPYRPCRFVPSDLVLGQPLVPPRLSEAEAIAVAWRYTPVPPDDCSAHYGSLTYPRYRRIDDGKILEPNGTRDFWRVSLRGWYIRSPIERERDPGAGDRGTRTILHSWRTRQHVSSMRVRVRVGRARATPCRTHSTEHNAGGSYRLTRNRLTGSNGSYLFSR